MPRSKPRRGGPIPGGRLDVVGDKPATLNVRCAASMRDDWAAAGALVGESLSEFMRAAADDRAAIIRLASMRDAADALVGESLSEFIRAAVDDRAAIIRAAWARR